MTGDVWELETDTEKRGCEILNRLYQNTLIGDSVAKKIIKKCFSGDSWKTIKERMNAEGSVWYVWYMDGVRTLLSLITKDKKGHYIELRF